VTKTNLRFAYWTFPQMHSTILEELPDFNTEVRNETILTNFPLLVEIALAARETRTGLARLAAHRF